MDKFLQAVITKRIERTLENIQKNNMLSFFAETKEQAVKKVEELLKPGATVTCGGSMTLFEAGIIEHLKSGRYNYLDRYAPGLTPEGLKEIYRKAFSADAYLTSSNAITENGELYNVDGNGNRIAAMIYGPESVIVVAGINKLVKNIDEAIERVKNIASPANNLRLNINNPCTKTGYCVNCNSPDRICSTAVVFGKQRMKDRIKVILVGEDLGY